GACGPAARSCRSAGRLGFRSAPFRDDESVGGPSVRRQAVTVRIRIRNRKRWLVLRRDHQDGSGGGRGYTPVAWSCPASRQPVARGREQPAPPMASARATEEPQVGRRTGQTAREG